MFFHETLKNPRLIPHGVRDSRAITFYSYSHWVKRWTALSNQHVRWFYVRRKWYHRWSKRECIYTGKFESYGYSAAQNSSYLPAKLLYTIPTFVMSRVTLVSVVLIAVVVSSASALSCFFKTCSYMYHQSGSSHNLFCVEKHGSKPHSSYKLSNLPSNPDDLFTSSTTLRRDGGTGSNSLCNSRYRSDGKKISRTLQTNWDFSQTST